MLFYKTESDQSMASLENITFDVIRDLNPWEDSLNSASSLSSSSCEVVAITHTARNIGQINVQILFYVPSSVSQTHGYKLITNTSSMESIKKETSAFMNTYLVPS